MAKFAPKDPALVARALQILARVGDPKLAAEELRAQLAKEGREAEAPAWRTIYYWRNQDKGARPAGKLPIARRDNKTRGHRSALVERAAGGQPVTKPAPSTEPETPPGPPPKAPPAPAHLSGAARRLWYVQSEIADLRDMLAQAKADVIAGNGSAMGKVSSLTEKLQNLLEYEAKLEPNDSAKVDQAREMQERAARVVAKIERGLREVQAV